VDHRPKLHLVAPGPSAQETAAIVGALEAKLRSVGDTVPTPAPVSPWLRAGLLEGVARADDLRSGWDDRDR
jgi:hypothetical protein